MDGAFYGLNGWGIYDLNGWGEPGIDLHEILRPDDVTAKVVMQLCSHVIG